jgi:HAE1 family hydrophobic/amphiphilic exporter-1
LARSIYSFWSDRFTMTRIYLPEGRSSEKNLNAVRRTLRGLLPEIAGVKLEVQETMQFWRPDRSKRIAFQLVGEDSEVLSDLAAEAKRRLGEIPGLLEPFASSQEGQQEMHVRLDRELASRYGITPQQAADVVGLTFRGRRLQRFRTTDGEREMRLTLDEQRRGSLSQLHNLPLWTPEGQRVPLASLASFEQLPGADNIQRDNRRTSVWVGARYEEGSREQYMPLVTAAANALQLPTGYSWTFGRWQERQRENSQEFLVSLGLALMLVFVVMAALFESARQAAALMVALPFALSGAVWTLYLTRTDFDLPASLGLLLLIGIVVNNGIVMIEHINMYRRQGMPRDEAMMRGGRERLRPILMTALTTLIGLAPIVIQRPALGSVYYYSMALVIMGGLAVSTVLTAVLLPPTAALAEDAVTAIGRAGLACGRWLRRPRWPARLRLRVPRWRGVPELGD